VATFYDLAAANRRKSLMLVGIVVLILVAFATSAGLAFTGSVNGAFPFAFISFGVGFLLTLGAWFGGDRAVLAAAGAKPLDPSAGAEELQLSNIIEELSIAANIPKPKVYLIDDTALNAFATGRDPQHASIAVTKGLMTKLDREEMSGVIGHELSHVRNFDIRYSLLVAALVGSLALLSDLLLRFTFYGGGTRRRSNDDRGGGGIQIIFFVLTIILAIVAPIAARMVQLAVSRQREYLADASGIELTRNPQGLERALAKLSGDKEVLEVATKATAHLYIVNPVKSFESRAAGFMATHPPLTDRINRLRTLRGAQPLLASEDRARE
jgi:heat shock protein HtpX